MGMLKGYDEDSQKYMKNGICGDKQSHKHLGFGCFDSHPFLVMILGVLHSRFQIPGVSLAQHGHLGRTPEAQWPETRRSWQDLVFHDLDGYLCGAWISLTWQDGSWLPSSGPVIACQLENKSQILENPKCMLASDLHRLLSLDYLATIRTCMRGCKLSGILVQWAELPGKCVKNRGNGRNSPDHKDPWFESGTSRWWVQVGDGCK